MPQYITIKNFGPITSIEKMEVKDFMLFIGERATGKSTIAKLIYFFKSLKNDFLEYYFEYLRTGIFDENDLKFNSQVSNKLLQIFGSSLDLSIDFELTYQYSDTAENYISFKSDKKSLKILYGEWTTAVSESVTKMCEYFLKSNGNISYSSAFEDTVIKDFQKSVSENLDLIFNHKGKLIFIPSQRSLLTTFPSFTFYDKVPIDYFVTQFSREISKNRAFLQSAHRLIQILDEPKTVPSQVQKVFYTKSYDVLKGSYFLENDVDMIRLSNNVRIKLNYASSGQQESIWILNILESLIHDSYFNFLVIEEPESHLDPKTQTSIIEAIMAIAKLNDNQILLTTHSPYVLASINNLMYAHQVGQSFPEEVKKVVPESLWLDPSRVGAYECKDGGIVDLIAPDDLIMNEKLDEMGSIEINKLNNDLFAIKNEATHEL